MAILSSSSLRYASRIVQYLESPYRACNPLAMVSICPRSIPKPYDFTSNKRQIILRSIQKDASIMTAIGHENWWQMLDHILVHFTCTSEKCEVVNQVYCFFCFTALPGAACPVYYEPFSHVTQQLNKMRTSRETLSRSPNQQPCDGWRDGA